MTDDRTAAMLKALDETEAQAKDECPPEQRSHLHSAKVRDEARARLAALPGPALLQALEMAVKLDGDDCPSCGYSLETPHYDDCWYISGIAALAECAAVLLGKEGAE